MSNKIISVRGMNDILPAQSALWQFLEGAIKNVLEQYGYCEVRMPIVEKTELFARSIGEATDVVEKEMFTFVDREKESLSLRPEGTAGVVRAGIEAGLFYNQTQRWWYCGPMFRHERPQKGRYRQFYQLGAEAFGFSGPDIDAEMIIMTARFWQKIGIDKAVTLHINSLGTSDERKVYREKLVEYLSQYHDQLDEDSKRRLHSNPLRILDSKNPALAEIIACAPKLTEYLSEASLNHFNSIKASLDSVGIKYVVNPYLVRGLDYYSHIVFEWVTDALGAQGTVCAGGRYDGLIAQLGGQSTPGIGFAVGLERVLLLIEALQVAPNVEQNPDMYLILLGDEAQRQGIKIAETIREKLPNRRIMMNCGSGGMKAQFKRADKSGAKIAIIAGESELLQQEVAVKCLREQRAQQTVKLVNLTEYLHGVFA